MVKFVTYWADGDKYNCDDSEIEMLEKAICIQFPDGFRKLLKTATGKTSDPEGVNVPVDGKLTELPFGFIMHGKLDFLGDKLSGNSIYKRWNEYKVEFGDQIVPFSPEGGGNGFFAFRNDNTSDPPVVYIEWDVVDENEVPIVNEVADSFNDFLKMFI